MNEDFKKSVLGKIINLTKDGAIKWKRTIELDMFEAYDTSTLFYFEFIYNEAKKGLKISYEVNDVFLLRAKDADYVNDLYSAIKEYHDSNSKNILKKIIK